MRDTNLNILSRLNYLLKRFIAQRAWVQNLRRLTTHHTVGVLRYKPIHVLLVRWSLALNLKVNLTLIDWLVNWSVINSHLSCCTDIIYHHWYNCLCCFFGTLKSLLHLLLRVLFKHCSQFLEVTLYLFLKFFNLFMCNMLLITFLHYCFITHQEWTTNVVNWMLLCCNKQTLLRFLTVMILCVTSLYFG
jgi:hypothetical protein